MHSRSRSEVASLSEAHALLGLSGPTAEPVLTAAFRAAVKAAHPSTPAGDEDRFRRVIAAWRLIQSHQTQPLALAAPGCADLYLPGLIRSAGGLSAIGDDLFMDAPAPTRVLEDGGRLEIDTHAGVRSAWLAPGQTTLRLRLKHLGLPARGRHPQGHLFVTLRPSEDAPSAAEDLLLRFSRVWTPDRLAA